jgi:hypothetical protein
VTSSSRGGPRSSSVFPISPSNAAPACLPGVVALADEVDFRFWQILLQKSAAADGRLGIWLRAAGIDPPALTPYATPTLRDAQSMSGWRSRNQRREPPQVLGGSKHKLVLGASCSTQSKPTELQNTLQVCEPHLDLLALATSQSLGCQQRTGQRRGRVHGCRAGSCAMGLLDSTGV